MCLAASKVDAATGRTLTLALAATIIPQLAHQVSGKYPATIKRIISEAVSPSDQDPQHAGQPELGALFLRLASSTPLANLPDTTRAYVLNIIREKASLAPNSPWSRAAALYDLTAIPKITKSSYTVSRELDKPGRDKGGDPGHCWFHNSNGIV
jgi:hypothetical protein